MRRRPAAPRRGMEPCASGPSEESARRSRLAAALALVLVLPLAGCERVEREVDVGYRGPARLNPYLAAERLFTRLGVRAHTSQTPGLAMFLPNDAVLSLRPEPMSAEEVESMLQWTESGGQLIYAVPPPEAGPDALLARLQVSLRPPRRPVAGVMGEDVLEVGLPPGSERARVAVPSGARLFAESGPWMSFTSSGTKDGALVMTFDRDPGRITLLADASFLLNENIGRHDHARLAWHLVDWRRRPEHVTILYGYDEPPLGRQLARHAWTVLVAGSLLLAACLWRAGARFGPVAPDPPAGSRALLEHVEAAGEFLWRQGRAGDLVEATRQALLRRVELRQPGWARLPRRELARRLAGASGVSPQRAAEALEGGVASDPTDVLTTIQTLETLRRSL